MPIFDLITTLIAPCLQLAIVGIFIRRGLYKEFPCFAIYTLYSIGVLAVRLSMSGNPRSLFVTYWTTEIIYGILALLALYEVFRPALEMYYFIHSWQCSLSSLVFAAVAGIALWRMIYRPLGHGPMARFAAGAYALMPGILCIEAIIFLFCLHLGLKKQCPTRWGRYRAGILVGFGLAALASVLADACRVHFGRNFEGFFRYVPAAAYIGATLLWLIAFWGEETVMPLRKVNFELLKRAAETIHKLAERAERDWHNFSIHVSS